MGDTPQFLGENGPVLVLTGRMAIRLHNEFQRLRRRAREGGHAEEAEWLSAAILLARHHALERNGTLGIPPVPDHATIGTWSSAETAKKLGTGRRNVNALAARGTLPATKVGREWRFDPLTVDAYMREKNCDE